MDNISKLIKNAQSVCKKANMSSQDLSNKLKEILSNTEDRLNIVDAIQRISDISEEASAGAQEVSASINQQADDIQKVATSSDYLQELSTKLNSEIIKFRIQNP